MKNKHLKIVTTVFSLLLCFTVFAQRGGLGGRNGGQGQQRGGKLDATKILSMLDTNNDNKIDASEAAKARRGKISEHFNDIDVNDDSFIDLDELKASLNNRISRKKPKKVSPEELIEKIDDNDDGKLNELEIAAKDNKLLINNFKEIDTNQDSEIELTELKVYLEKNRKKKRKEKH